MAEILMINGSPRAPKSNSKLYARIFAKNFQGKAEYIEVKKTNYSDLSEAMEKVSDVLLVFPLYADSIPVTLLHFLKYLEEHPPKHKPTISVLINCGFLEYRQNDLAVRMVERFCRKNEYKVGSVLEIGSGEAILTTPFKWLVQRKIRKLAVSILRKRYTKFGVTMPISAKMFVRAGGNYWTKYGQKNGITKEEMQTMKIEGGTMGHCADAMISSKV